MQAIVSTLGLNRAVGIMIALGPVTSLGTAMLAPEAGIFLPPSPAVTDFIAIATALDPLAWGVTGHI
jgi:hypothetical protein